MYMNVVSIINLRTVHGKSPKLDDYEQNQTKWNDGKTEILRVASVHNQQKDLHPKIGEAILTPKVYWYKELGPRTGKSALLLTKIKKYGIVRFFVT